MDQSHLVFRGHKSSIDNISYLTSDTFLSAGQDGMLQLWRDSQKAPVASISAAHGMDTTSISNARWISSLACVKMSDLAVTGSNDGYIRLWKANIDNKTLAPVNSFKVDGFVNCLAVTENLIAAGVGREHRLGRWWKVKGDNHNKVVIMKFKTPPDSNSFQSDEDSVTQNDSDNATEDASDTDFSSDSDGSI